MSLKIKICGMTDPANMHEIAATKPDFFGLIFYPPSPRFVPPVKAEALPQFDDIKRVGVFVNENASKILEISEAANLSFIQLHGAEPPAFCWEIRRQNLKIIKAFQVNKNFDGSCLKEYEAVCEYFLFDTQTSKHGGSGRSFDWTILQQIEIRKPFFLSGGIGAENVAKAIRACANLPLFALDINSRAEAAPGIKSEQIIRQIIKNL